jgi:hypothetical protein
MIPVNGGVIPAELIREGERRLAEASECQAGTDSVSFQVLPASTGWTATSNQSGLVVTKTGLGQSKPGGQTFAIPPQLRITDAARHRRARRQRDIYGGARFWRRPALTNSDRRVTAATLRATASPEHSP